jgi:hypothetical protein
MFFITDSSEELISFYVLTQRILAWWAFLLALGILFAFSRPIGIIQAITNTQIGLNVLAEFVFGYI